MVASAGRRRIVLAGVGYFNNQGGPDIDIGGGCRYIVSNDRTSAGSEQHPVTNKNMTEQ